MDEAAGQLIEQCVTSLGDEVAGGPSVVQQAAAQLLGIVRHVFAAGNAKYPHALVITQTRQQLGRDEEVLASAAAVFAGSGAGDVD